MTTNCPECGHDWLTPGDGRLCGKPHCFCRTCAAASPQEDAAPPVVEKVEEARCQLCGALVYWQTDRFHCFSCGHNGSARLVIRPAKQSPSLLAVPDGKLRQIALSMRREAALWPKTERAQQTARLLNSFADDILAALAPLAAVIPEGKDE